MRSRGVLVMSAIVVFGQAASLSAQTPSPVLSAAEVAVACAPSLTVVPERPVARPLRIIGSQDTVPRSLFGNSETVVVSGGTGAGLLLDQQYFIRRAHAFGRQVSGDLQTIHTTGWLRIVAVNDTTAIAQIENICDGVIAGDYLEPFVAPPSPTGGEINTTTDLDFASLGRVLFGDEMRRIASPGDFMILMQGNTPLAPGTRVAVYRDLRTPGIPLAAIGEGVIVKNGDTELMHVTSGRDAIESGDYIVPHK